MNPIQTLSNFITSNNLWEDTITLKRNEYLLTKGSLDGSMYFVESGSVRIFITDENEEHTIRFGYQNNLITALDTFLSGNPTELNIQTIKKTKLKKISRTTCEAFISGSNENLKLWNSILESFVLQQMEREHDILITSPLERYQRVLKRSPQLFQEIPEKYIASYLRMAPETLSRIKKS